LQADDGGADDAGLYFIGEAVDVTDGWGIQLPVGVGVGGGGGRKA